MTRVVAGTGNQGKLREIAAALGSAGVEVMGLDALADPTLVEETGSTFEENARLKAEGYSRRTRDLVLADDSGLEVDALAGAPGVRSARFGGPGLDDAGRCRALLDALATVPDGRRGARFVCVVAIARGGTTLAVFRGEVAGTILREMRGAGGFGYDPIFFHPPSGRAFAELAREEKERVSHRGAALAGTVPFFTGRT